MATYPGSETIDLQYSFTISNKAYVGSGRNGDTNVTLSDFWEYNPTLNAWTRVDDFPFEYIPGLPNFKISHNNKAYIFPSLNNNRISPVFEYNPETNEWAQITDYVEDSSVSTQITEGLIGLVLNKFQNYMYRLDIDNKRWVKIKTPDFNGNAGSTGIIVNNKIYILRDKFYGGDGEGKELWEYTPPPVTK
ncbi:MAG: kelch repeat-containing protein [Cyclobacteriaceae bacterium]